jgi:hypothetical protein
MADLHPTPTRLKLLRAVRAGDVLEGINDEHTYLLQHPDPALKVCARIKEADAAGWVELPEDGAPLYWRLTEAGRKVLEEADRGD